MTYQQAALLGLVQGLTEFLPVSSSGHLILVPYVASWPDQGLAFDAAMHLGTLVALLAYFRRELAALISGTLSRRVGLLVLVASVPALALGWLLDRWLEANLRSPLVIAIANAFWALVMWVADRRATRSRAPEAPLESIGWRRGLAIGCAQALALIPGTSRSGITITAALFGGLDRATAARFAFLLGIPATAAAGGYKTLHLLAGGLPTGGGQLAVAMGAACLSGWIAVWFLVTYLRRRTLLPFVLYRLVLAAVIFAVL